MGKMICVCREAKKNCYLLCAKGRRIEPDKVYQYDAWNKEKPNETILPK